MQQESAETIALKALAWLVGNDDLRPVFLGASGLSEADLRNNTGEAAFLASVLDFLVMDDTWIVAFCDDSGLDYQVPMRARAVLPGGDQVNWT